MGLVVLLGLTIFCNYIIKIRPDIRKNLAYKILTAVYGIWESGRQLFKTIRWTVKAVDENNQLNNVTNVSIVKSFPEPLHSIYGYGFYIYPDCDSNYARAGSLSKSLTLDKVYSTRKISRRVKVTERNLKNLFTTKGWVGFGGNILAVTHEEIRDSIIKPRIDYAKNSSKGTCTYNISASDKWYLEKFNSISPEVYVFTHAIGERVLTPGTAAVLDTNFLVVIPAVLVGAAYIAQDLTRFKLLERDMTIILDYLNAHPECIISDKVEELAKNGAELLLLSGEDTSNTDL